MKKIVIDTDIIFEHLVTRNTVSLMRRLVRCHFCYTTVFNAMELFSLAENAKERKRVEDALRGVKILGLNGRSAKNIGGLLADARNAKRKEIAACIAGVCRESALPIVSINTSRFTGLKGLKIIAARDIIQQVR